MVFKDGTKVIPFFLEHGLKVNPCFYHVYFKNSGITMPHVKECVIVYGDAIDSFCMLP